MPQNNPPENLPITEEPLKEFLKREEIKTMAKDVAGLRELEAKKEREKISTIKAEPVAKETPKTPGVNGETSGVNADAKAGGLIPKPLLRKKGSLQKILIRALLVVFFVSLLAISLYLASSKNKSEEIIIAKPVEKIEQVSPPEPPLIAADRTKVLKIADLGQLLAERTAEGSLTRILLENPAGETLLSAFGFSLNGEVLEKLEKNYTLAAFGQKEGARLAFIAKTKDRLELINSLKKWEGEKGKFKTAASQGTLFRYLTLGKNDLGICYLVLDDYFVLTNSFGTMARVINELNFEKKLGQLLMVGFDGKTLTPELETFFKKYRPGALLLLAKNIESREQLKTLNSRLQALSLKETGLPLLIAADQEGGVIARVSFLNEKTPQKEIADAKKAFQIGQVRAQELKSLGVNLNLAPVLDEAVPGDFLFERSFQKPTETAGELAKSLIAGQKAGGILTGIKHFPGYSGIAFNPENKLAELPVMPEISQFKKALEANPEFVMTANVIYQEIDSSLPFSFSREAVEFLKNSLGENILILSDDLAQDSLINKFSLREVLTKPLEAGVDIMIFSGYKVPVEQGLDEFFQAYKNGEISRAKTERAVDRVIQLKNNLLK